MKRVLAIDFGAKRVGLAISDPTGKIAQPYGTLLNHSSAFLIEKIKEICRKEGVGEVVVGLPLTLKGEVKIEAERVQKFVLKLTQEIDQPVLLEDERFTTIEARRLLKEGGKKGYQGNIDTISAVLILAQYLEKR